MSVAISDLKIYGSATMPDDDTTTQIGGAIDTQKKIELNDISASGNIQIVSSAAGDTTQTVATTGRDATGVQISETKTLNGTTVVPMTAQTTWERLLKAVKSATTTGDVAVEAVTADRSNTAQGGGTDAQGNPYIDLDAGASGSDDAYNGKVIRLTGGTGVAQIRQIVDYVGSSKRAYVNRTWTTAPDATSTFKVSPGMVFDKSPAEVLQVRRPFYNAAAPATGTRKYYEKLFFKNTHATLALTSAVIKEASDPSGKIAFMLPATLDDTGNNGAGNNRQVAPSGTFNSSDKNVANSQNHTAGAAQGTWIELSLAAGDAATKTTYTLREEGTST